MPLKRRIIAAILAAAALTGIGLSAAASTGGPASASVPYTWYHG